MDFADLIKLFFFAFTVALSGALMPGPMLTVTISEAMKNGFKAGPLIVLGHAILELFLLVMIVLGLHACLTKDLFKVIMGLLGGGLLCVMGLHMALTSAGAVKQALSAKAEQKGGALHVPILAGVLSSLSNPYWTIWWATIGLNFVIKALDRGVAGFIAFYTGHTLADLVWYSLVAWTVASGRRICAPAVYRGIIIFCGLALVLIGLIFVTQAVVVAGASCP